MNNKSQLQQNNTDLQSILSTVLGLPTQESCKTGQYVWKYKDGKVKDELPSGYTRIGHIVSDGRQWIDTGVIPNSSNFSIKSLIRSNAETSAENWFVTIGHDKTSGAAAFLQFGTNASLFEIHLTNVFVEGTTAANNNDIEVNFSVSGTTATLSGDATHTVTNSNLSSGTYRSKSICICDGSWRTYGVQITVAGTIVRNLVPAKNSSGIVGLYDTIGNTFYTSSGTGQFTEGSDPFWTFAGYAVDNVENKYPDGGTQNGKWYEYFINGLPLETFGCTKYAIDKFSFSADTSLSTTIYHNLGTTPTRAFIIGDVTSSGYSERGYLIDSYYTKSYGSNCYYYYCVWESFIKSTKYAVSNWVLSDNTVKQGGSCYYRAGVEYTLITMA